MANLGVLCFDTLSQHSGLYDEFIYGMAPRLAERANSLWPAWNHMQAALLA